MCGSNNFLDDILGIDPPAAPAASPVKVFSQSNNPSAASTQDDLTPGGDGADVRRRRKGRSDLKIDRNKPGTTGLNIPQA